MKRILVLAALAFSLCAASVAQAQSGRYISVGAVTEAPVGYKDFCARYAPECDTKPLKAYDVVMSPKLWTILKFVNAFFNVTIKPITDMNHWGVVEKWDYPDDGYGDCEDYVLAKRRELMQNGWPRQALLITVVRDQNNEGHAVLTVKTNEGEYILDNLRQDILLWSQTGYHFNKRQSQTDPNLWMSLDETSFPPVASVPPLRITIGARH